jgi:anaerobic ribonucleoside-triphosphate reductase
MTELESINAEITALEKQYSEVQGTQSEVYSRIVGYYRSVSNWNPGKRQEFEEREVFDVPEVHDVK